MDSLLRTPSGQEPGISVERLVTKEGNPAKVGERAYDRKTGRLAQVGLHQQIAMNPSRKLTSLQGDFLASHSVAPGSERARMMTVTSGLRCLELSRKQGPLGAFVKTLLASSVWVSTKCFLTWKGRHIKSSRFLFQLAPSMPRTEGIGFGLLGTMANTGTRGRSEKYRKNKSPNPQELVAYILPELLKTPSESETEGGIMEIRPECDGHYKLRDQIAMLPTPKSRDFRSAKSPNSKRISPESDLNVYVYKNGKNHGLKLQPAFVEWMMGYPDKWTELTDSKPSGIVFCLR
jgi:hypothetical protein